MNLRQSLIRLSLKRKIILVFSCFFLTNAIVWFLSYYNFFQLNIKLELLYLKNDLLNTVLEARRYEKNYLLNGSAEFLEECRNYSTLAREKIDGILRDFPRHAAMDRLQGWRNKLDEYQKVLDELLAPGSLGDSLLEGRLISLGRELTGNIEKVVTDDHLEMQILIKRSSDYLIIAVIEIVGLSLLAGFLLFIAVNRPLKALEKAIKNISSGRYENIPDMPTSDEFNSLITSLNKMIADLNKRTEELIQASKMASLGTLTSGVAHELNNPLNNISTSCQILLEELEEDDLEYKRGLLREMEQQIDRARDIVKDLLEFSRERSFKRERTNIKEIIESTITLIKGELPSNVELRLDLEEGLEAEVDSQRIQQALLNLILNAIQAMEKGGVLSISAGSDSTGEIIIIRISDTGPGIPREDLPRIFDPFFTTKEVGKGTGLGLSITYGIIKEHDGKITVESKPGQGTTFEIRLPAKEKSNEE